MLIRKPDDIASSEITSESAYLNRRAFLRAAGIVAATLAASPALACEAPAHGEDSAGGGTAAAGGGDRASGQDDKPTPYDDVTTYNNFYEFGSDKEDPARNATKFRTRPWTVRVEGLVKKPADYQLEDFLEPYKLEDRVYRMRCVEAWSMVIPWRGFPLRDLVDRAEPLPGAKFVEFTTLYDPQQMPGQRRRILDWPYVEGLRLDEARHPLAFVAVGLYGKTLPNQNGAPLRLVVPWKYGFKGGKSIVKVRFTDTQPRTTWNLAAPQEYGFYANVKPTVDHPRWSQAKERRIGEFRRRPTLMFNGYADQVASLYAGMDLRKFY